MSEYSAAAEMPKTEEDRRHIVRRVAANVGRVISETTNEFTNNKSTRRIAGGLALLGAASTAAELGRWFDHSDALLEFIQGSGRHFIVGYVGAVTGAVTSKAETMRGRIAAGVVGAAAADVLTEAGESLVVTGALHHGSFHDILSFASKKEIFWGNAKDALAAELAVVPALAAGSADIAPAESQQSQAQ